MKDLQKVKTLKKGTVGTVNNQTEIGGMHKKT